MTRPGWKDTTPTTPGNYAFRSRALSGARWKVRTADVFRCPATSRLMVRLDELNPRLVTDVPSGQWRGPFGTVPTDS